MGAEMRGDEEICGKLFSYIDLEKRIRANHPLRVIREIANAALKSLSGEFAKLYSPIGRVDPAGTADAMLLQAFYSIRSERQLVERIDYDLLFRKIRRSRLEYKNEPSLPFLSPLAGERSGRTTTHGRPLDPPSLLKRPLRPA
jgi:hypothetical protein